MKTQVIPAQITTVEDRIAGSLSLTQIMLLLSPVLFASFVFALLPPSMAFVWYKVAVCLGFTLTAIVLSFRIKEKLVLTWIGVLFRYNVRAKYYVFNKNDQFMRRIESLKPEIERLPAKSHKKHTARITTNISGLIKLEELLSSGASQIRFTPGKKGGLHVALEKVPQKD